MSLLQFLQHHRVPHKQAGEHEHARQGWVQVQCPWCRTETYRLGINIQGLYANCWACGPHPIKTVLHKLTGASWREIEGVAKHPLGRRETQPGGHLRASRVKLPNGVGPLTTAHEHYLRGRGFDPDEIRQLWGIRGIGIHSRLSWRLWIPVFLRGELVSWTSRSIGECHPRYLSARPDEEVIPLKQLLYGQDYIRSSVIVCEGPTDVWRIGPGAVATFGMGYSQRQLIDIAGYPVRIICFDNERDAQRRAERLAVDLAIVPGKTSLVRIESGDDIASADPEEVLELRRYLGVEFVSATL